jgi:hypothetical protein
MGRRLTGAWTTGETVRIELSYLLKHGYIKKNCTISGTLSWTNGRRISITASFTEEERYLRISYITTSNYSGEKSNHDDKIQLT